MMDERAAASYVLRLLARREYCAAQVRSKLVQRGADPELAERVIRDFREQGLLSDRRFAESYLRSRLRRGEAMWLAVKRAAALGVDPGALDAAREALDGEESALDACRHLLAQRDPQGRRHEDERIWQKQARFLRNKGYDAATILRALNERVEGE